MDINDLLKKIYVTPDLSDKTYRKIISEYAQTSGRLLSKSQVLNYLKNAKFPENSKLLNLKKFLTTKPTRTISGVAPITLLTKPYPCPGKCIFCPYEKDQPKSYLSSEPGAARARALNFDPFLQIKARLLSLKYNGHNTEKIEVIILGGTWSYYPKKYQAIFILRVFQALNDSRFKIPFLKQDKLRKLDTYKNIINETKNLNKLSLNEIKNEILKEQVKNENSLSRSVGLVIETRPDYINKDELKWLRFLGVTKIQLGLQSLNDNVLRQNKRGHNLDQTMQAINLIRLAGFKIHIHFMPNLYSSNIKLDEQDYKNLFSNPSIRPDEIKLYPCIIIKNTKLYELYKTGKYKPYTKEELLDLLTRIKPKTPEYCRISRLFRDIPSFEIKAGIKQTNFREIVQANLKKKNKKCRCIRCREIRDKSYSISNLKLAVLKYETSVSNEYFISFITRDDKIAAFLRLTVPYSEFRTNPFIKELKNSSIIREIHVYGKSLKISQKEAATQHIGLGKALIQKAENITLKHRLNKISVISAIGTRNYYRKNGFRLDKLYMHKSIRK